MRRIVGGLIGLAIFTAVLVLGAGCASAPQVYRLGPDEGLVLHDKNAIVCVGVPCQRLWKDSR